MNELSEKVFRKWYKMTPEQRAKKNLPATMREYSEEKDIPPELLLHWADPSFNVREPKKAINEDEIFLESIKNLRKIATKSPEANKTLLKAIGRFVERSESKVDINLNAADYLRLAREARYKIEELSGKSDRVFSLPGESTLLLEQVRSDTEQEHEGGGEVGSVGLSTGTPE